MKKYPLSVLVLSLAVIVPTDAYAEVRAGLLLREALLELNQRDANLMFSTRLVEEGMRVATTPTAGDPLDIAREILVPHHLTLVTGPVERWIVARTEEKISGSSVVISGRVVDGNTGEPIVGSEVTSGAQTARVAADGHFSI